MVKKTLQKVASYHANYNSITKKMGDTKLVFLVISA